MSVKDLDLQSYGELEKHLYGGKEAYSFFNRKINKCLPFTQIPQEITKKNGSVNFGYTVSLIIDNSMGDYLSNIWAIFEIPEVKIKEDNLFKEFGTIRWTKNLLHNLIEECSLMFNDNIVSKLNNFSLDFISEFLIEDYKYNEYKKRIGNIPELIEPSKILKSQKLMIPLYLFFCNETGNSIPLVAIPYTEIKLEIKFKNWENLIILENNNAVDSNPTIPIIGRDIEDIPIIKYSKFIGNFVTVSEEERTRICLKTKYMMIEQFQTSPRQMISTSEDTKIEMLFKQSVKCLFFTVRNCTYKNVWSNYSCLNEKFISGVLTREHQDIVKSASIKYNGKYRVIDLPSDYFNYINPFYHATRIPDKNGLYMYSFSLDQKTPDPNGGTCLSKIESPQLNVELTDECKKETECKYELVVIAATNNILKISEGLVTLPII